MDASTTSSQLLGDLHPGVAEMDDANWKALTDKNLGLTKQLGQVFLEAPFSSPSMRGMQIGAFSDYGGSHHGSSYEVYSILVADMRALGEWELHRSATRDQLLRDNRRMSYKGLKDRLKAQALTPFLQGADTLHGLCVAIAVRRSIPTLFDGDLSDINPQVAGALQWKHRVFERALRIAHLVSFLVAGLAQENQDVFWFTDEDDVVANDSIHTLYTTLWANILSHYLIYPARHVRLGTSRNDDGSNQIEDLLSIPDLVAGAVSELLTCLSEPLSAGIILPMPPKVSPKALRVGHWLTRASESLKKTILVIDSDELSRELTVSRISFVSQAMPS
jgi:hypothetical protein